MIDRLPGSVRDFLAGLGLFRSGPGPLASGISVRPQFSESDVVQAEYWPSNGPERRGLGQTFATGLALRFTEVRAVLLGLTANQEPDTKLLSQYFRMSRAISLVLAELLPTGLTLEQHIAAIRRLYQSGLSPAGTGAAGPPGPAGPAGKTSSQATTDSALSDSAVVKRVSGGHVDLATGSATGSSDGVVGVALAAASGALATFYTSGTRAPIAGLGVGPVFRDSTGYLTTSPATGLYTVCMGFSDNVGVDVLISQEFKV